MWTALLSTVAGWFGRRLVGRVLLSALGVVLGYVLVTSEIGRATEPYIKAMLNARRQAAAAVSYGDSLARVAVDRQRRITVLEGDIRSLRNRRPSQAATDSLVRVVDSMYHELPDSVVQSLELIPLQQQVIHRQDSTIRILDQVVVRQDLLLVKKDSTITELRSVRDSLRIVLTTLPEPPSRPKLLGLVPIPSRKTAAIAGFLGGIVVTAVLMK